MRFVLLFVLFFSACIQPPPEVPTADASDAADMAPDAEGMPSCDDGLQNGDETDVDCGGSCTPCEVGDGCVDEGDCEGVPCDDGTCTALRSCKAIQDAGLGTGNGEYIIDADGAGEAEAVTVYCDMETDGGVGYTMYKFEDPNTLENDQAAYHAACEAVGMEVIVPRTRGHGLSILEFNGGPPNLVGVFPKADPEAETTSLKGWTGICQGEPCRFYLSDNLANHASCSGDEPSGDASPEGGLFAVAEPTDECPIGQFNDQSEYVARRGYVICSTNDAGPPTRGSCLEILEANALQNTDHYGPNGMYEIQPEGADAPISAYCDFIRDGGGYTYRKVGVDNPLESPSAESVCDEFGMQLLVPRTENHLTNAFFVGLDSTIGPSGSDDYLRFLGVYPEADMASCDLTPMTSANDDCAMEASDAGPFFVHDSSDFNEPDGSDSLAGHSLVFTWTHVGGGTKELTGIAEPAETPTAERFICSVGDKMGE